ncbi:unnamed protein product [Periconia digitata]|uniref:Large ribosomal subunit protein bL28m n=1 Tax=Periconia digitata TaxID=1303443 RepID=A0A9W4XDT3_9PLEO|nr:unnamed protein product [Periconia digitata]
MPPSCQLLSGSLPTARVAFSLSQTTQRGFSSSSTLYKNPLARRRGGDLGKHEPKYIIPQDAKIPEYPYGPNLLFKQSNKGLYGGQMIQFGNNISRKTKTTTRRFWKPNVLSKGLYSVALKKRVNLRVTSKTLRVIDNEGGLDNYLLKPSDSRIKELGPLGWALRWTLMQKPEIIERMRGEAAALGIPQEQIDQHWPTPTRSLADREASEQSVLTSIERAAGLPMRRPENEKEITEAAEKDYLMAMTAAKRYKERGLVDSLNEAVRLAFIRENTRAIHRQKNLEAAQEAKREHPGILAERRATNKAKREEWIKSLGGQDAYTKMRKEQTAQTLQQAFNAMTDETMPELERTYYTNAIEKARRATEAGSVEAYAEATVIAAMTEQAEADESSSLAWAAIADQAANPSTETRPSA